MSALLLIILPWNAVLAPSGSNGLPHERWVYAADNGDAAQVVHNAPSTVVEARARAQLLHETIHGALQVMHRDFFREDEKLTIPSRSLEDVFRELARSHGVEVRWLAVNAEAMNVDHKARTDFEKNAVKALATGKQEFENEPINYGKSPTNDPVTRLQKQLETGQATLEFDDDHGYLRSVLKLLDIRPSSQVLVNSKTSFQLRRISPRRPRALYFNDQSSVGWVQGGDVVEVMTTDPVQGEVFYTLSQEKQDRPQFIRDRGQCIVCHASSRTQGVPGGLVRSVFVDAGGQPQFGSGTFTIDHRSPFDQRWGGWYVTGTHGKMRHMGNVISNNRQNPEALDRDAGANVTDLADRFNVSPYLTPHSDIVALMVLEHQTQMQEFTDLSTDDRQAILQILTETKPGLWPG